MAYDVFISYSNEDKSIANAVCSILESNQIRCWIAPRDITVGISWSEGIIDGMKDSKVFVLIFSSHSNKSRHVMKEVGLAVDYGMPIIPLRIEDVPMSKQLEFYVSDIHWLDAITPPLENHINKLCKVVQVILSMDKIEDIEDIKEAFMPDSREKHSSWMKDEKNDDRVSDREILEEKKSTVDSGEPSEKFLASEDSTRKFNLKKFLIPALVLVGLAAVVIALWFFTEESEPIVSSTDYVKAGYEFLEGMDYEEALNQFNKALTEDPTIYEAQIGIATILFRQEKLEEATKELQKAINLNDEDPYAFKIMGEIFKRKEELEKAIFYFSEYLRIIPDSPDSEEVNRIIKTMEAQLRPPVTPEEPVREPVAVEMYDYSAALKTGINALNQGFYDQCINQMEEILKVDPDNIYALHYLAEAKKEIEIEITSNYESALEAFAEGNYRECIEKIEKVLQLDPQNIQSKKYLDLAKTNLYLHQIGMVVHQYVRSVENNILSEFYEKKSSPRMYEQISDEIQLISRLYHDIHATVSDHSVQFIEMERAEVTIICQMTGVSNDKGKRQIIFEGTQVWVMVMEGETWIIEEVKFIST